ncbi:MAG: hypothetical protein ABI203_02775, partial [Mucilaginibacter sp.]
MNPSQESIVKYLTIGHIPKNKATTEEDLFMYEYLVNNGLMTVSTAGTAMINNEGKSFVRNAYYFNPVPLTVYDWIMNITNQLKDGKVILKGDGNLFDRAVNELKQDGIIEQVGTSYQSVLTS